MSLSEEGCDSIRQMPYEKLLSLHVHAQQMIETSSSLIYFINEVLSQPPHNYDFEEDTARLLNSESTRKALYK